jgi:hypothetical protein
VDYHEDNNFTSESSRLDSRGWTLGAFVVIVLEYITDRYNIRSRHSIREGRPTALCVKYVHYLSYAFPLEPKRSKNLLQTPPYTSVAAS